MVRDPWIGQKLGKYEILSLVGHGGMGSVYRARHTLLPEREVAIKFLRVDLIADPTLRERFRREATAIAELRHPHIVQLYDMDECAGGYYMVLELIRGLSLGKRLAQEAMRLPFALVQKIMDQTLDALAHVHAHGVVHRDLKPDNLLLDAADDVFLTDFGIARRPVEMGLTGTGQTVGTLWYMAPEQLCNSTVDCRADLYSVGVVLYELLTGQLPFTASNPAGLVSKQQAGPRPPRAWTPEIPLPVEAVVLRALALAPEYRYQSAAEFREALAQAWTQPSGESAGGATQVIPGAMPLIEESGIPSALYTRLLAVLLRCASFQSNDALRAVFIETRLHTWQPDLPEARTVGERARATIAYLSKHFNTAGENVLVLLLHVLAEQTPTTDAQHQELKTLAVELERALAMKSTVSKLYALEVLWYVQSSRVLHLPEQLLGRDTLLQEINAHLYQNRRVLLYGMGGIGKTALAAMLVKQRIDAGQPVIWMRIGDEDADAIFGAIVRKLATDQQRQIIASLRGEALAQQMSNLLARSGAQLLVLDDVWNLTELHTVLDAIPTNLPVLLTSRTKFSIRAMSTVPVDALPDEDALNVLAYYAKNQRVRQDEGGRRLCHELGNHTYALEIAGALMDVDELTPDELWHDIAAAPHELAIEGRESITRLLDRSLCALRPETQAVFKAWGAFFTSEMTPDFLAVYLGQPEDGVKKELRELARRSLAKRLPTTQYELHDLTFSYARGMFKASGKDYTATINAVQHYVDVHAQDFDVLFLNRDNILGAAGRALRENPDALVAIITDLATGGYLDARGHTPEFARLLDETIRLVEQRGTEYDEMRHYLIGKRGNIYVYLGDWENALAAYQMALNLSPDDKRRAILLSGMGKVCSELKLYTETEACFRKACDLAESQGEAMTLAFVLQQQSVAAGRREDYETARDAASRAVRIIRSVPTQNDIRLAYSLLNLGSAEIELGNVQQAIALHTEAYRIAETQSELALKAAVLYALGQDYHVMGHRNEAQQKLEQARRLFGEIECTTYEIECALFMREHEYLA